MSRKKGKNVWRWAFVVRRIKRCLNLKTEMSKIMGEEMRIIDKSTGSSL